MSELRKDLVSGRWVIIATERSKRPDDFRPVDGKVRERTESFCPFCEGHERKTPPEVYSLRQTGTLPDMPGWKVRVVPNKFPALTPGQPVLALTKGLHQWLPGIGIHEVVIENPDHNQELSDLPVDHIKDIFLVFQQRIMFIEKDYNYQYVQVFKNKGKEAGASLTHPHFQIVATPIVPKRAKEEIYGSALMFRNNKKCVFCRMLKQELDEKERIIAENKDFLALAPFASRFPFEMAVYPVEHDALFSTLSEEKIRNLAEITKDILTRLKKVLQDPPFNMVLHQAPNPLIAEKKWPELNKTYHWHLEIMPILTKVAGFELGTGFYINPVAPETAAEFLRVSS